MQEPNGKWNIYSVGVVFGSNEFGYSEMSTDITNTLIDPNRVVVILMWDMLYIRAV